MGSRQVMSKLDLVLANSIPILKVSPPPTIEETLLAADQVVTAGGGGAGRNSLSPGLLRVCSEADCWESPMTLKHLCLR